MVGSPHYGAPLFPSPHTHTESSNFASFDWISPTLRGWLGAQSVHKIQSGIPVGFFFLPRIYDDGVVDKRRKHLSSVVINVETYLIEITIKRKSERVLSDVLLPGARILQVGLISDSISGVCFIIHALAVLINPNASSGKQASTPSS
jgi:hypothetical protein